MGLHFCVLWTTHAVCCAGSALLTSRLRRDFGGVVPTDAEGLRAVRVAQRELGITDAAAVKQLQALRGAALEAALEEAVAAVKTRGASADPDVAVRALEGLLAQRRAVAAVYADALAAAEAEAGSPEGACCALRRHVHCEFHPGMVWFWHKVNA